MSNGKTRNAQRKSSDGKTPPARREAPHDEQKAKEKLEKM
jgi:hypothetical protein